MLTRPLFGEPRIAKSFSEGEAIVLYQGEALEFLRGLPCGLVSLVVTSPPYNLGKAYERRRTLEIYLQEQANVIQEFVRLPRKDGSTCWKRGIGEQE